MTLGFTFYLMLLLFGACIGTYKFQTLRPPFRAISLYLLAIFTSELIAELLSVKEANNMIIYHALIPFQLIFYTWIYRKILTVTNRVKAILYILSFCFIALSLLNSIFIQNHLLFPSNSLLLISLFVLSNSLLWFKSVITKPNALPFNKQPEFWFNIGNLFFYSITFFVFGFYNYIAVQQEWIFNLIWMANLFMYVCYILCIYAESHLNQSLEQK